MKIYPISIYSEDKQLNRDNHKNDCPCFVLFFLGPSFGPVLFCPVMHGYKKDRFIQRKSSKKNSLYLQGGAAKTYNV